MSVVGETCLKTAARLVTAWSGDRERLTQAAELCWQAGFWFLVDWPERIRERYGEIYCKLVGPRTFQQAIEAFAEPETRELADSLLRFAREALDEAAIGSPPGGNP